MEIKEIVQALMEQEAKKAEAQEKRLRESLIKSDLNMLNHHDDGKYLYFMYNFFEYNESEVVDKYIWADNEEHAEELYSGYEFYKVVDVIGNIDLESSLGF